MRLLGSHTLAEAIEIAKGVLFASDIHSRSGWNVGVKAARQKFQESFYPQDEYSLRLRRHKGLPSRQTATATQSKTLPTGWLLAVLLAS